MPPDPVASPPHARGDDVFVIMGAAVRPGGEPSGALQRRVASALTAAAGVPSPLFLASGGVGKYPPAEAVVMARLLAGAGIPPQQVIEEAASTDTLSSIQRCAYIIHSRRGVSSVTVCSDRYHTLRCRWLLRLCGIRASAAPIPSGRASNGVARWSFFYLREVAAIPVDTVLLLVRGRRPISSPGEEGGR